MADLDIEQNSRIRALEDRVNDVESSIAAMVAQLAIIEKLCKGLFIVAGVALGVDVMPILEGA